jgi:hypothetical protein
MRTCYLDSPRLADLIAGPSELARQGSGESKEGALESNYTFRNTADELPAILDKGDAGI